MARMNVLNSALCAHLFEVVAMEEGERQVLVGAPEPVVRGRLLVQHPLALVLTQRVHRCALGRHLQAFSRQAICTSTNENHKHCIGGDKICI